MKTTWFYSLKIETLEMLKIYVQNLNSFLSDTCFEGYNPDASYNDEAEIIKKKL